MHAEKIDWELFAIDGTVIRASVGRRGSDRPSAYRRPEDHALGRSKGGFSTKLHLVCDGVGTPLAVTISPGQEHETQQFVPLMVEATA